MAWLPAVSCRFGERRGPNSCLPVRGSASKRRSTTVSFHVSFEYQEIPVAAVDFPGQWAHCTMLYVMTEITIYSVYSAAAQ